MIGCPSDFLSFVLMNLKMTVYTYIYADKVLKFARLFCPQLYKGLEIFNSKQSRINQEMYNIVL